MAPTPTSHIPALLLFILLAAAAAAHASIYRTTITTTTATQEEVPGAIASNKKCEEEMQQRPITACRSFLKYGGGGGGNPEKSAPEECCEQLRRVSEACRCEMVKMMTGEIIMKEQQAGGGEMGDCRGQCAETKMRGAMLPAVCAAGPPCLFSYGRSAGMY